MSVGGVVKFIPLAGGVVEVDVGESTEAQLLADQREPVAAGLDPSSSSCAPPTRLRPLLAHLYGTHRSVKNKMIFL